MKPLNGKARTLNSKVRSVNGRVRPVNGKGRPPNGRGVALKSECAKQPDEAKMLDVEIQQLRSRYSLKNHPLPHRD